jgi:hypothetical protein
MVRRKKRLNTGVNNRLDDFTWSHALLITDENKEAGITRPLPQ